MHQRSRKTILAVTMDSFVGQQLVPGYQLVGMTKIAADARISSSPTFSNPECSIPMNGEPGTGQVANGCQVKDSVSHPPLFNSRKHQKVAELRSVCHKLQLNSCFLLHYQAHEAFIFSQATKSHKLNSICLFPLLLGSQTF